MLSHLLNPELYNVDITAGMMRLSKNRRAIGNKDISLPCATSVYATKQPTHSMGTNGLLEVEASAVN